MVLFQVGRAIIAVFSPLASPIRATTGPVASQIKT